LGGVHRKENYIMKTIKELTKYFGYYMSNKEFNVMLEELFIDPANYDNKTLYRVCKKTKLEIGFTNERMIRPADKDKPMMGGRPVFTHFNLFPKCSQLFETLPYGITFADKLENVREKAGIPVKSIDINTPILGWNRSDQYEMGDIKLSVDYNPENNSIKFIQVSQGKKAIKEETG
jgi:hypothetical protein